MIYILPCGLIRIQGAGAQQHFYVVGSSRFQRCVCFSSRLPQKGKQHADFPFGLSGSQGAHPGSLNVGSCPTATEPHPLQVQHAVSPRQPDI